MYRHRAVGQGAAGLLRDLGARAEAARDLAYRLYTVCERKNWAQEALGYNMLVVACPRLLELSAQNGEQGKMYSARGQSLYYNSQEGPSRRF